MKHPAFTKKPDAYAGTFTLADFSSQGDEQRLNVAPLDVATDRTGKDQLKRGLFFFS